MRANYFRELHKPGKFKMCPKWKHFIIYNCIFTMNNVHDVSKLTTLVYKLVTKCQCCIVVKSTRDIKEWYSSQ